MIQTMHSFCIKEIDSFSQEARSSPVERAQGSSAALRASLKLGMPARQLRRGCAAGKILDGKAFGGRCAGQKSSRGTHVVLLCFLYDEGIVMNKVRGISQQRCYVNDPFHEQKTTAVFRSTFRRKIIVNLYYKSSSDSLGKLDLLSLPG